MTSFDLAVLLVIGFSILFAFVRGVIRELIALIAWIAGVLAALAFAPEVAGWLPGALEYPGLRYLIAFTLILIAVLVAGAVIAWPLAKVVRAAGLGFVDRFLGSIFGLARGLLVVVAFVLAAGFTGLPRSAWWQESSLAGPLTAAALVVAAYLPHEWAAALDYSPAGRSKPAPVKA